MATVVDLSVVIVSWNTHDILRRCLRSVFENLGALAAEVFVVDNGSSDGSADMVEREFSEATLIRNPTNRGFAAANNQAMSRACGRYILLLNSDTEVLDSVLSRSVHYMDANPSVGVFACRVLNPDGSVQPTCFMSPSVINTMLKVSGLFRFSWPRFFGREHLMHWNRDSERDVDVVTGCYLLARSSAVDEVGLLDERFFFFGEETDWCKRFDEAGWEIRFAPVGEIVHIGNASGRKLDSRRDLLLTKGLVRFHRKHSGAMNAFVVWVLLAMFNATRFAYWCAVGTVERTPHALSRKRHFREILGSYASTWPGENR